MGATKEKVMDYFECEHKQDWMKANVPSDTEEDSAEWEKYSDIYDDKMASGDFDHIFFGSAPEYLDDDNFNWSRKSNFHDSYVDFKNQLESLRSLPKPSGGVLLDAALKMRFSYAVTLMEACLGDMLKNVTLSDDFFKEKAISGIKQLTNTKVSLANILGGNAQEIVDKEIYSELTDLLYHNIEKVNIYYSVILGLGGPNNLNLSEGLSEKVHKAVSLRHDVAHRNGRDKEGNLCEITEALIDDYVDAIALYVSELYDLLDNVSYRVESENAQKFLQSLP